jgi:hypothetical protein
LKEGDRKVDATIATLEEVARHVSADAADRIARELLGHFAGRYAMPW